jgi:hypothetical protein
VRFYTLIISLFLSGRRFKLQVQCTGLTGSTLQVVSSCQGMVNLTTNCSLSPRSSTGPYFHFDESLLFVLFPQYSRLHTRSWAVCSETAARHQGTWLYSPNASIKYTRSQAPDRCKPSDPCLDAAELGVGLLLYFHPGEDGASKKT